jgi:hypothetical protein
MSLETFFAEGKIARVAWAETTKQWLGCLLIKTLPLHVLDELVITLKRSIAGITNVIRLSAKEGLKYNLFLVQINVLTKYNLNLTTKLTSIIFLAVALLLCLFRRQPFPDNAKQCLLIL